MRLISPHGVTVFVSDEKGERLKGRGYTEAQAAPAAPRPARRSRQRPAPAPDDTPDE